MNILILGGDKRQQILKELLCKNHIAEHYYSQADLKKDFSGFDTVILPYPYSRDGKNLYNSLSDHSVSLEEINQKITHQKVLSGGNAPIKNSTNYAASEMLLMLNAVPTAEAAVALAINSTDITLQNSSCLIIGNGRIGKVLARLLLSFGARVTVSARKESDYAYISAFGYSAIQTDNLESRIENFDIIFNTVPFRVLNESALGKCKKDAVLIELASSPFGFDHAKAESLGLKVIKAPALPGKTAPKTAAQIINKVISDLL